jgi:hypothetical protein
MFVSGKPIQLSLVTLKLLDPFVSYEEIEVLQIQHLSHIHKRIEKIVGEYVLAYFAATKKKSFLTSTPGASVIKHFFVYNINFL